jgi:hypothetical protein
MLGVTAVFLTGLGGGMSLDNGVRSVPDGLVNLASQLQPGGDGPTASTWTEASRTPNGTPTPVRKKPKDDERRPSTKAPKPQPTATAPEGALAVHGIAVDPAGAPIAGMYVYAGDPGADTFVPLARPAGVTGTDGRFSLACPDSPVLLTPWPLNEPAGTLARSARWTATFVGGATNPRTASEADCHRDKEPAVVRLQPGSAVEGTAEIAAACNDGRSLRLALFGDPRISVKLTEVNDGQAFRVAGLPPGEHVLSTADVDRIVDVGFGATRKLDLSWPCDAPDPTPTTPDPTPTTTPTPTSTPTATSEPTPSTSQPPPLPSPSTSTTSPSGAAR